MLKFGQKQAKMVDYKRDNITGIGILCCIVTFLLIVYSRGSFNQTIGQISIYAVREPEISNISNLHPTKKLKIQFKREGKQMQIELDKLVDMRGSVQKEYHDYYLKQPFDHLPGIVIAGTKKCGTKALLTFLLSHPKIVGNRQEFHWHTTGNFTYDLMAFFGHLSKTGISNKFVKDKVFITKTYMPTTYNIIKEGYKEIESKNGDHWKLKKWLENVLVINMVCDPAKRLYSDFLHVKAEHKIRKYNVKAQFLGENSLLYPYKDFNFDEFVDLYIPAYNSMPAQHTAKSMIRRGFLYQLKATKDAVGDRLIILDGATFKTNPAKELQKVESAFLDAKDFFFTRDRFQKRSDGFYCIKKDVDINDESNLICMPKSKGRSKTTTDVFSEYAKLKLHKFYYEDNLQLQDSMSAKFSWLNQR